MEKIQLPETFFEETEVTTELGVAATSGVELDLSVSEHVTPAANVGNTSSDPSPNAPAKWDQFFIED